MKTKVTSSSRLKPVRSVNEIKYPSKKGALPEVLFITSFPPRQCGIATYSEDLIAALNAKFHHSFDLKVCALENANERHEYESDLVEYVLDTDIENSFFDLATEINQNDKIKLVVIQHEFGFYHKNEADFIAFLKALEKPVSLVFHTVLPNPNETFKQNVLNILAEVPSVIVMTHHAADLLVNDYGLRNDVITVIPHGTHLVAHKDKDELKEKYGFEGRTILSTFGLLGPGKSIETSLEALPAIVRTKPEVLFLIIGKTHPTIVKEVGEVYRQKLEKMVADLGLQNNVKFINKYVQLDELLEYLQLTDIYLFTSNDPNQAVSGTFSYAMSCGCPIISTPIPHAKEMLKEKTGILFDFNNSAQLSEAVNTLLYDVKLKKEIILNALHKITPTTWENAAVAHAQLFEKLIKAHGHKAELHYRNPELNLDHIKKMTTDFAMYQFAKINKPDIESGFTLDDNARAMIAVAQHYKLTEDEADLPYLNIYLDFIQYCQQADGLFLNYVDINRNFTDQNAIDSLEDSNGRGIWALGYLISLDGLLPEEMILKAKILFHKAMPHFEEINSTRAMSFIIKGMYYYTRHEKNIEVLRNVKVLADKLVQMYRHESQEDWKWFEGYLTYANSVIPEAVICAYALLGNPVYRDIAKESFDFLLKNTFTDNAIKVISNRSWLIKGQEQEEFGEQPIDIAYTIIALRKFHDVFKDPAYVDKMEIAFNWFLGNNHLQQIIYNPCTGGCYDGLEEKCVNLNQGAESTVSYLMARLMINKHLSAQEEEDAAFLEAEPKKEPRNLYSKKIA